MLRGQFNAAKVLRALAHAQRVQAAAAARLLAQNRNPTEMLRTILVELEDSATEAGADAPIRPRSTGARERAKDIACQALASIEGGSDVKETDVAQSLWGCYGCGFLREGDRPDACPECGSLVPEFAWFGPFSSSTPEHLGQLGPSTILATLEAVPDEAEAAVAGLDEARLGHQPPPGEWCIREIAGHLLETDILFARQALALLASEAVPSLDTPFPSWTLHEGRGYEDLPVPALVEAGGPRDCLLNNGAHAASATATPSRSATGSWRPWPRPAVRRRDR